MFSVETKVKVTVPVSTRWLDNFVTMKCAPDLLAMRLFPNAKEITESMAVFGALEHMPGGFGRMVELKNTFCLVPGDGVMPRTGAIAAFRTKWDVWSVDPLMRATSKWDNGIKTNINGIIVKRLRCTAKKIEKVTISSDLQNLQQWETGIILAVHSHAPLHVAVEMVLKAVSKRLVVVALPCCTNQFVKIGGDEIEPMKKYLDKGIYSPKNEISIWDIEK